MKKILKKLTLLTVACLLLYSMAACGNGTGDSGKTDDPGLDFTAYPDDFSAWTVDTMQTYLADCGLLGNEEFMLLPLSETDVAPLHAVGGFMYMDSAAASVMNVIYAFNPEDAESKATLDGIVENKAIVINGTPVAQMDAVLNQFAFSYLNGTDDTHIAAFIQAIRDLGTYYGIDPAYVLESGS